jgi:hypothetical protein
MNRIDYLKECISDVSGKLGRMVPIDDFNRTFCVVCVNRDCTRSKSNNLKFESRVNNWQDIYFNKVQRAADQDPKFENIRVKKFISPEDKNTYIIKDPEPVLAPPIPEPALEPALELIVLETPPKALSVPESELSIPELSVPEPKKLEYQNSTNQIQISDQANTPFAQGTMLPGSKVEEKVLEPGQVFVFDDD